MHVHGEIDKGVFRIKEGSDPADEHTGLTSFEVSYPATVHETITYRHVHDHVDHLYAEIKGVMKKHMQMHAQTGVPCAICKDRPLPDIPMGDTK